MSGSPERRGQRDTGDLGDGERVVSSLRAACRIGTVSARAPNPHRLDPRCLALGGRYLHLLGRRRDVDEALLSQEPRIHNAFLS